MPNPEIIDKPTPWIVPERCSCGATCDSWNPATPTCAGALSVDEFYDDETGEGGWIHLCEVHQ